VAPVVVGVAVDLSHIDSEVQVTGFAGDLKDPAISKRSLRAALKDMDVVVIPAGVPRKPGMSRDDLFSINAGIVAGLVQGVADICPHAIICVISNPVNSTVPIAAEVLRKNNCLDPRRLFGVSTLDVVRANKFVASQVDLLPGSFQVPVIGGHSGVSILPLLSQLPVKLTDEQIKALTTRIQNAGTEVVEAKAGGGSATLSMAYAGARFTTSVLRGLRGESGVYEYSYVSSSVMPEVPFFASKVRLGTKGWENAEAVGTLSPFEKSLLENEVKPEILKNIDKGMKFASSL